MWCVESQIVDLLLLISLLLFFIKKNIRFRVKSIDAQAAGEYSMDEEGCLRLLLDSANFLLCSILQPTT